MDTPEFTEFVLTRLQAEGTAFSAFDFALFDRGSRSWHQLIHRAAVSMSERDELAFTEASALRFIECERFADGSVRAPARVQARFLDRSGDAYILVWERTLEAVLNEFYEGRVWPVVPVQTQEVGLPGAR